MPYKKGLRKDMKTLENKTQTQLSNELFEILYNSEQFEKSVTKIQSKLNRWKERDGYHDKEDTQNLLVSALYERLSRAKVITLQRYSNSQREQDRLISLVATGVIDDERNGGKVYTMEREFVETDLGVEMKQVRNYRQQVSFDKEFNNESSDYSFTLGDAISVDDIRIPDMREINKSNVVQVLKNIELFSKPSQGFVAMLFTEGSQKTQELLGMTTSHFNEKITRLENWIAKHEAFSEILTGQEAEHLESLTEMAHFEIMLDVAERTQVAKWLVENQDKPWVEYILDEKVDNANCVLGAWDKDGMRKNSYQFIDGIHDLESLYKSEVSR